MQYKLGLMASYLIGLGCGIAPCFLSNSWAKCLGAGLVASWVLFGMWLFYRLNATEKRLRDIQSQLYGQGFVNGELEPLDNWFEDNDWLE